MFGIRVAAFILSLLLASHAIAPDDGWFIALAVLSGLSLFGWYARVPRIYTYPQDWGPGGHIGWRPRSLRWQDER